MTLPIFPQNARSLLASVLIFSVVVIPVAHAGTIVEIETSVGSMTLELFDDEKPITVANFLAYVESGRYENLFGHRLDPGFVLQSGGYTLVNNSVTSVPSDPPITNEFTSDPQFSNTFGTIAMAKIGGMPDSATSQWFLNLGDNSDLDSTNGGFTVFGRVVSGLDVLTKFNTDFDDAANGNQGVYDASSSLGGAFTTLPLLSGDLTAQNLVYTAVTVISTPTLPDLTVPNEPPVLAIKGKKRIVTKRSRVVLKGSASAPGDLERVEFKAPGSKPKTANGSSSWSIKAKLRHGRNAIKIWAVDTTGQISKIQKTTVIRKR